MSIHPKNPLETLTDEQIAMLNLIYFEDEHGDPTYARRVVNWREFNRHWQWLYIDYALTNSVNTCDHIKATILWKFFKKQLSYIKSKLTLKSYSMINSNLNRAKEYLEEREKYWTGKINEEPSFNDFRDLLCVIYHYNDDDCEEDDYDE